MTEGPVVRFNHRSVAQGKPVAYILPVRSTAQAPAAAAAGAAVAAATTAAPAACKLIHRVDLRQVVIVHDEGVFDCPQA